MVWLFGGWRKRLIDGREVKAELEHIALPEVVRGAREGVREVPAVFALQADSAG